MLFIVQPGTMPPIYWMGIIAPILAAFATVMTKLTYRSDRVDTTYAWISVVSLLVSMSGCLLSPSPWSFGIPAIGIAVLGAIGTYGLLWSIRLAEVSALAPYTLLRLPLYVLAGLLLFSEAPSRGALIGTPIIVASCLLSSITRKRNAVLASAQ